MPNPEAPKGEMASLLFRNSRPDVAVAGLGPGVLEQFNVNDCTLYASALGALGLQGLQGLVYVPSSHGPIITPTRPASSAETFGLPYFGADLNPVIQMVDGERLRQDVAHAVRESLGGFVPGVEPGVSIVDALVDVTLSGHQVAIGIDVSFAATPMDETTIMGTWSAPESQRRTEWFMTVPGAEDGWRVHNDYVDSMQLALSASVGLNPPNPPNPPNEAARNGYVPAHDYRFMDISWVSNPMGSSGALPRGRRVEAPLFEIASNPTIHLDEVRHRRFGLMDRATQENIDRAGALGRAAGRRLAAMRTPHPFIGAVLKKRFPERSYFCRCPFPAPINPPEGGTICGLCSLGCGTTEEAPRVQKLTVWEMLRANYALFE